MISAMKDDVSQFKRELILRTACELFCEHGYPATTIEMLARRLSTSKTAIYAHFAGKADLLFAIIERSVALSVALAERVAQEDAEPAEQVRRIAHDFALIVIDNQDYIAVACRELSTLAPPERAKILGLQERFDFILRRIIEAGVARGDFAVRDAALAALGIGGMVIWIHSWYRADGRLSPADIALATADSALRMVQAPPQTKF